MKRGVAGIDGDGMSIFRADKSFKSPLEISDIASHPEPAELQDLVTGIELFVFDQWFENRDSVLSHPDWLSTFSWEVSRVVISGGKRLTGF